MKQLSLFVVMLLFCLEMICSNNVLNLESKKVVLDCNDIIEAILNKDIQTIKELTERLDCFKSSIPIEKAVLFNFACSNSSLEIVQFFIKNGFDPNQKDTTDKNAFEASTLNNDKTILKYFLNNYKDANASRLLAFAISNRSLSSIKILVSYGADFDDNIAYNMFDLKEKYHKNGGSSTEDIVRLLDSEYHNKICQFLLNQGKDIINLVSSEAREEDIFLLDYVISYGIDINSRSDSFGTTPLLMAIIEDASYSFIKYLLKVGVICPLKWDW